MFEPDFNEGDMKAFKAYMASVTKAGIENGLLQVQLKGDQLIIRSSGPGAGPARLTAERWDVEKKSLWTDKIKQVLLRDVIVDIPETLFSFLLKCKNVKRIEIVNLKDGTKDNTKISKGLKQLLNETESLNFLRIQQTVFGLGWGPVLQSVPAQNLQILALGQNELGGFGEHLVELLAKTTDFLWLEIADSGLERNELSAMVATLPLVCPRLNGLILGVNKIMDSEHLITAVQGLPRLKALTLERCKLKTSFLLEVLQALGNDIELLAIEMNDIETKFNQAFINRVQELDCLKYLRVSGSQLKPADMSHVTSIMKTRFGELVCDPLDTDEGFKRYVSYLNNLCQQCGY